MNLDDLPIFIPEVIAKVEEIGLKNIDRPLADCNNQTLLSYYAFDEGSVLKLLELGASVNAKNKNGLTVLMQEATFSLHIPCLRILLDHGAEPMHEAFDRYCTTWPIRGLVYDRDVFAQALVDFSRKGAHRHRLWIHLPKLVQVILARTESLLVLCFPPSFPRRFKKLHLNIDLIRRLQPYM